MTRCCISLALVVAFVDCSSPERKEEPPPAPVAELPSQEILALEKTPGSTPPLMDATQAVPALMAGLDGAPGPSPAYGPASAPVYVFVLSDFECSVCRRIVEPIKYLARRHPKDVRVVVKHNALVSHPRSAASAAASIAAFRQGKFWHYSDRLFSSPGQLDGESLVTHARAVGLDADQFRKDMDDPATAAQVKYESALATSIDLGSTPGFIINGATQMGWSSYVGIQSIVDRELSRAKQIAASGVPPERVAYEATRQSGPNGEQLAAALFPK